MKVDDQTTGTIIKSQAQALVGLSRISQYIYQKASCSKIVKYLGVYCNTLVPSKCSDKSIQLLFQSSPEGGKGGDAFTYGGVLEEFGFLQKQWHLSSFKLIHGGTFLYSSGAVAVTSS